MLVVPEYVPVPDSVTVPPCAVMPPAPPMPPANVRPVPVLSKKEPEAKVTAPLSVPGAGRVADGAATQRYGIGGRGAAVDDQPVAADIDAAAAGIGTGARDHQRAIADGRAAVVAVAAGQREAVPCPA